MPSTPPPAWSVLCNTVDAIEASGERIRPILARFVRERLVQARDCILYIESRPGADWSDWETELITCWYLCSDPIAAEGGHFLSLLQIVAAHIKSEPDLLRKLPSAASGKE